MRAFSKPSDGIAANADVGTEGEIALGTAGTSQRERSAATIVPEVHELIPAPCCSGGGEVVCNLRIASGGLSGAGGRGTAELSVESTGAATAHAVSAASPFSSSNGCHLNRGYSTRGGTDLDQGGNGLSVGSAPPDETPLMTEGLRDGPTEVKDDDIAAADWLEVTHALLDEVNESVQACGR